MIASFLACLSIEWLNTSYTISYITAAVSLALALACVVIAWRRKVFFWLAICATVLVCHPAWRLAWAEMLKGSRAATADCGFGARGESIFLTAVATAILLILVRGKPSKRSFIFILTIACWAIHALAFALNRSELLTSALYGMLSPDMGTQIFATIEAGSGRITLYTLVLTLCCGGLYLLERRRRRLRSIAAT
jgi:hypothetical protein